MALNFEIIYEFLYWRYVVEKLESGQAFEAQEYDMITISYSDIVGFTKISAQSTPMQVSSLPNLGWSYLI